MGRHLDLLDHAKALLSPKGLSRLCKNTDQKAGDHAEHTGADLHVKGLHRGQGHHRSKAHQKAKENHLDCLFAAELPQRIPDFGILFGKLIFKFLYGLHGIY